MFTHIHCKTLNQPTSVFSWMTTLTKQELSSMLHYDPNGATVSRVYDALASGCGVEIYTRQVERQRGTQSVGYCFLPCTADHDPKQIPHVRKIMMF
jgi:hypothetical protein